LIDAFRSFSVLHSSPRLAFDLVPTLHHFSFTSPYWSYSTSKTRAVQPSASTCLALILHRTGSPLSPSLGRSQPPSRRPFHGKPPLIDLETGIIFLDY
jgi:hypothetical protein